MEAGIAAALRDGCDEMDGFAARLYGFIDDYHRLKMTTDEEAKRELARALYAMRYDAQVSEAAVDIAIGEAWGVSTGIYVTSRWMPNYDAFRSSHGHLYRCMTQLYDALHANIRMDDPTTNVNSWAQYVPMTGDVPTEMLEYEKDRKGARP